MPKVIEVKFLRAQWYYVPQHLIPRKVQCEYSDSQRAFTIGLDIAHSELEKKITEYLKLGWEMKGDVTYVRQKGDGSNDVTHLVQTMVKYEMPTSSANLLDLCNTVDDTATLFTEDDAIECRSKLGLPK
jgi:hypothetical protein